VDDDEGTVALFRKILAAGQWEVDTSHSGHDAAGKIRPGHYDLIVSDLYMPNGNGFELYESAIRADPNLSRRFIFVSGYSDSSAVKSFLLETGCPGIRKPIRIDEFQAVVAYVAEEKPLTAAALPSRWFTPDAVHLYSGEITGRHTLFALLNRIYSARLIGVLDLLFGRAEKKLFINFGNVVFASSNLPDDGLGEVMMRQGALTQSQFEEATRRMQEGQRFGFALVDLGACDLPTVAEWVRKQVTQIATSVFENPSGRYYFFDSFEENVVPEVGIALPMGRLLLPALRAAPDLPLDDLAHDEGLCVDLSPDPRMRFQDVQLNEDERLVLAAASRPMSAADVYRSSGIPVERAARALYTLLALGMAVTVPPERTKEPSAAYGGLEGTDLRKEAAGQPTGPATAPPTAEEQDREAFEKEMTKYLALAESSTHYQMLEVTPLSATSAIKAGYYKLARKFHPDRHMGHVEWIGQLQQIMDALTAAYKTLSDQKAREQYDKKLAGSGAFSIGRIKTEKEETAEECLEQAKQCLRVQNYAGSITWLRKCVEIAPNDSKYRAMLARSLASVPQYRREAVEHFEKAIQLDPWNTSALFQFAELFEEMQLLWRARPLYVKVLDIDPEHTKARAKLRALDAKEGKKDEKSPTFIGRLFSSRKPG
jgi:CheY-like chemotaxis protein/tetratricopeptide (TPR) repeat protein